MKLGLQNDEIQRVERRTETLAYKSEELIVVYDFNDQLSGG